jgi:hypothetical protein
MGAVDGGAKDRDSDSIVGRDGITLWCGGNGRQAPQTLAEAPDVDSKTYTMGVVRAPGSESACDEVVSRNAVRAGRGSEGGGELEQDGSLDEAHHAFATADASPTAVDHQAIAGEERLYAGEVDGGFALGTDQASGGGGQELLGSANLVS